VVVLLREKKRIRDERRRDEDDVLVGRWKKTLEKD
jgi:hypothetical protein